MMLKKKQEQDPKSVQYKLHLVTNLIHPSLRRVYDAVAPTLKKDLQRFLKIGGNEVLPGYEDAKRVLDDLHYPKGLAVLCARYTNRSEEYLKQRFSHQFICQQGYEFYQREHSTLHAAASSRHHSPFYFSPPTPAPSASESSAESDSTSTVVSGDVVVRAEHPHNLEFWISNIPHQPSSTIDGSSTNDGTPKERIETYCCTYSSLFRNALERRYSLYSTTASNLKAYMLETFDFAYNFIEMDRLKHAIDGMEDLGLDDMLVFGVDHYLNGYLILANRFLVHSNKRPVNISIPGRIRMNAVKHRDAVHAAVGRPVQQSKKRRNQMPAHRLHLDGVGGFDVFDSHATDLLSFEVFGSTTVPPTSEDTDVDNTTSRSLNWHLSRLTRNFLEGVP
jgi:hypothetical protein